ncbi:hypothetical protein BDW60DRAFT_186469 [Aspergillus nidulans var. acristatus]
MYELIAISYHLSNTDQVMQKCKTKIPILILVHNSNDETNTVDRTYVIMEHAIGVPLHNKWHRMLATSKSGAWMQSMHRRTRR